MKDDGIVLIMNEDGVFEKYEEPYMTIECAAKEDFEFIQKAIEKQTAKKPDFEGDGYDDSGNLIYDTWICPNCGDKYEIDYEIHQYCPMCGQKLDWSDVGIVEVSK